MAQPTDQIARQIRVLTERFLEPFAAGGLGALTKQEVRAVSAVVRAGPLSMGELAGALSVVQSAVTPLVDRLATAGLVIRVRGESDRRVWLVQATDTGRTVADEEDDAYRALAAGFLDPLTPEEGAHLARLLGRVVDALEMGAAGTP